MNPFQSLLSLYSRFGGLHEHLSLKLCSSFDNFCNSTTHNEYGLKAGGLISALEKFSTLFGLKLAYNLVSTAEVSKDLQAKDLTIQETIPSINLASAFYWRQAFSNM